MNPFYNSPGFGEMSIFEDGLSGVKISKADRLPCLVCGHPTGDCTGDSPSLVADTIWGYNTNSTLDDSVDFYIEEDVFEEREVTPGIVAKILIHKKGKRIPLVEARKLGFVK